MPLSARGAFIVVEGLDRSGKTTQTKLLAEALERNGKVVEILRFPGTYDIFSLFAYNPRRTNFVLRYRRPKDGMSLSTAYSIARDKRCYQEIRKALQQSNISLCDA